MEESVALDSSKQKKFFKSVRGIKKLLISKKKDKKEPEKPVIITKKSEVPLKKGNSKGKRKTSGLVYLSHIPHGFYEQQMTEYFKQFGVVTNARVIRSPRTGNSKGYAFVEFKEPAVAEIVAETMNNYLMGKRLIKAAYIPPEKQKIAMRKMWNTQNNPSCEKRLLFKKTHNADQSDEEALKIAMKLLSSLSKTKQKLSELGINYDFFKPVDVPEALIDKLDDITETADVKPKKEVKEESEDLKPEVEVKTEPGDIKVDVETNKRTKKQRKRKHSKNIEVSNSNETLVKEATVKSDQTEVKSGIKQNKEDQKINKEQKGKEQETKKQKLKKAGVKELENFISIKEPDDSDSSIDFDSDEFDKMIENEDDDDDDLLSGDESEPEGEINDESELDEEMTNVSPKKISKSSKSKEKDVKKGADSQKKQAKGNIKRKSAQGTQGSVKKAKFEKQNSNKMPLNKVIKKRK